PDHERCAAFWDAVNSVGSLLHADALPNYLRLPGLILAGGGLLALARRRRRQLVASACWPSTSVSTLFSLGIAWETRPQPHRSSGTSRIDRGVRWPSRLVATAEEARLNIRRTDCRTTAELRLMSASPS